MIYGTGAPIAKLVDEDNVVSATLTLARPNRRDANGYEDVVLRLGTDADGNEVTEFQGVRYHGKFVWLSQAANQSDISTLQRLTNWRGNGRTVLLVPHDDASTQQIRCEVAGSSEKPLGGLVTAEEITVELWGVDVLPARPNPTYDRIRRVYGRGRVAA